MGVQFSMRSFLGNPVRKLMLHRRRSLTKFPAVVVSMAAMLAISAAKDIEVSDLVKKSLDSIGNEQARAAVKSSVAQGALHFAYISGGVGPLDGKQVLASEDNKMVLLLKLPNPIYHGERFVSDGKKTFTEERIPGSYSPLGVFIKVHDELLKEGLLGGALSANWALAHLDERHAKLRYKGLKKLNGVELHRVEYVPAKHSDLEIDLYFEADKFRHVLTTYSMTVSPQIAASEQATAREKPAYYQMEERFGDFKQIDNLQLPTRWILRFSTDAQADPTHPGFGEQVYSIEYDAHAIAISHNVTLDPKNFEVK
jgi:hypothetical protein